MKNRDNPTRHFEVMVGQSISEDRANRYFGLVQSVAHSPRNRLQSILHEQGFQLNQDYLDDGWRADDLEGLECDYASLKALRKAANEFCTYIKNNAASIPNYAENNMAA